MVLGQHDNRAQLAYVGYCGRGCQMICGPSSSASSRPLAGRRAPSRAVPVMRDDFRELPDVSAHWVRPAIVVEVQYRLRNGVGLRHAVLKGIRPDQPARQVTAGAATATAR